ncbi:hypothetical protein GQ43DRAFT_428440 [Delitschia confertaspora ATCC 74209]|uniref:Uncharacterized protein n=1 Tax=Delitschia confertaspora ATCC 74209 TaxID=1513339 RepID=A0A9P4JT25_9PLEO|nr:hypothetical protein GQ43DRAFT_428440 [Delitschia confertaspora ATCC 74209]
MDDIDICNDAHKKGLEQCERHGEVEYNITEQGGLCRLCQVVADERDRELAVHLNFEDEPAKTVAVPRNEGSAPGSGLPSGSSASERDHFQQGYDEDAQLAQIMEQSRLEAEAHQERLCNAEAELHAQMDRLLKESAREFEERAANAGVDEDTEMQRILAESRATYEAEAAKPKVDEDAELERILIESAASYEQQQKSPMDEETELERILQLSLEDQDRRWAWHLPSPSPSFPMKVDSREINNEIINLDPARKGKGRRQEPHKTQGYPSRHGINIDYQHNCLRSYRLQNIAEGAAGPSGTSAPTCNFSRQPGAQSEESRTLWQIRAEQQAAYEKSLAADKEKKAEKLKEEKESVDDAACSQAAGQLSDIDGDAEVDARPAMLREKRMRWLETLGENR